MSAKDDFLKMFDAEHEKTVRLLRAFPADQVKFKPNPNLKSAGELAWVFPLERRLGMTVWHDQLKNGIPAGATPPAPPDTWNGILEALAKMNAEYRDLIAKASDADLQQKVHFFVGPKTMGEWTRLEWVKFLLHDEIHHRGQMSIYVRAVGAKVPSIYGPTADEPWR